MKIAVALSLLATTTAAWAQDGPRWSLGYSESDGLHKLVYGKPETDGEVYLRCVAKSGWIFLIHDYVPKRGNPPVRLSIGDESISPSFRVEYDGVITDGFYVDMALPADHRVFRSFADGKPLHFEGTTYPVISEGERQSIRSFLTVCEGEG